MAIIFPYTVLGIKSSQLTKSYFSEGWRKTTNQRWCQETTTVASCNNEDIQQQSAGAGGIGLRIVIYQFPDAFHDFFLIHPDVSSF